MSQCLSVCPSVRLSVRHNMLKTSLEQSIFIFLGQRAIKSIKIRVIQSEPKILRLILFILSIRLFLMNQRSLVIIHI